jgi:hypothetical protein
MFHKIYLLFLFLIILNYVSCLEKNYPNNFQYIYDNDIIINENEYEIDNNIVNDNNVNFNNEDIFNIPFNSAHSISEESRSGVNPLLFIALSLGIGIIINFYKNKLE